MLGTFFQVASQPQVVNGMSDVMFGVKDLITIGGGIVGVTIAFITLKHSHNSFKEAAEKEFKSIKAKSEENVKELKESILLASTKKNAMRMEFKEMIEKVDDITHKRIDAVRDDLKTYTNKTDVEFKALNASLSKIEGMLSQIINQKNNNI